MKRKTSLRLKTAQEENMVLLFVTGMTYGVAITTAIFNQLYATLAALASLIVLWLINSRQ